MGLATPVAGAEAHHEAVNCAKRPWPGAIYA